MRLTTSRGGKRHYKTAAELKRQCRLKLRRRGTRKGMVRRTARRAYR